MYVVAINIGTLNMIEILLAFVCTKVGVGFGPVIMYCK